ncbi:MAG: hypothetical protein GX027_07270 [Clostridiaceae bacterium]|nr:hypothetical protein [Clostridiaceae bacterium]
MVLAIVLLSVLAFYGVFLAVLEILRRQPGKKHDAGFRIILTVPEGSADYLEGVIRRIFSEDIPEKLLTDGRLYVSADAGNPQVVRIIRDMQRMYPLELLPQADRYYMITGRGFKMSEP